MTFAVVNTWTRGFNIRHGIDSGVISSGDAGEWSEWPEGAWRKGLVAALIRKRSLVDNGWLARPLEMGSRIHLGSEAVSNMVLAVRCRKGRQDAVRKVAREAL